MKETRVKFNGKPNEQRIRLVAKQLLKEIMAEKMKEEHYE